MIGVQFTDGVRFVPEDQLETIPTSLESPVELLSKGKISDPPRLRQVLTHFRLTGRLADLIYSMEATNTDFYPFQFKPVIKMLNAPTGGVLIADEVGLGKTIEAGLIWTELRARYDMRRLLVVCPKSLKEKWRSELSSKFGITAEAPDAEELLRMLQDRERQRRGFVAISSLQSVRPPRGWAEDDGEKRFASRRNLARFFQEAATREPLFDLLVIDEAHHMRNTETLTYTLGELLRAVASHALFLSATPIHLKNRDLFALLRLLDEATFSREDAFAEILAANRPLVVAREAALKSGTSAVQLSQLVDEAENSPLLSGSRQLDVIRNELANAPKPLDKATRARIAYRFEQANLLSHVVNRTRRRDIEEFRITRLIGEKIVEPHPLEQEVYARVTRVIEQYADEAGIVHGFLLATPQRMMSSCIAAALQRWLQTESIEVPDGEDAADDSLGSTDVEAETRPLISRLSVACQELAAPEELRKVDTKYCELRSLLQRQHAEKPDEKLIVFSSFRTTLDYLCDRLHQDGFTVELLHGSIEESRDDVIERFARPLGASILLSSEIGSEGIDLQFARILINYDLPWNPMRVEQRIGRIDRIGQRAETITVISLLHENTIDARIYERLYQRLDLCRHALGDFEAVLGETVQRMTRDLLFGHLSEEQQEDRIDQAAQALENLKKEQEELEEQAASLIAHGDYILTTIKAAHEFSRWISGEDIRRYISDVLSQFYPGSTIRAAKIDSDVFEIDLSPAAKVDFERFARREQLLPDTRLLSRGGPTRCRFHQGSKRFQKEPIEVITQMHPLTRFAAKRLQQEDAPKLRPAVAVQVPMVAKSVCPGSYVVAVMKWSLGGVLQTEKLGFAGTKIDDFTPIADEDAELLALSAANHGKYWPAAAVELDLGEIAKHCDEQLFRKRLFEGFQRFFEDRSAENDDRAAVQLKTLKKHRAHWIGTRETIVAGHEAAGRYGLARAIEGQIRSFEDRCQRRREEIERTRQLDPSTEDIAVVLIDVA